MCSVSPMIDPEIQASPALTKPPPIRIIGVTGGVGMGKTTVSEYLKTTHGLPVLDADLYAREAVESGSQVLTKIVERYGSTMLLPTHQLDRSRLGEIVFSSVSERHWLEQQIHPYVRDRLEVGLNQQINQGHQTVVLVVPLLFEARMTDLVTEIWVVCSADNQQIERLQLRDQLDLEQIHARINSQMAIEKKLKRANVILDNSLTPERLFQQVDQALNGALH